MTTINPEKYASPENEIHNDFVNHGLSWMGAIGRLEAIGYDPKEAEELVAEWADGLEHPDT